MNYKKWHIPIDKDDILIKDALIDMELYSNKQFEVPIIVQIIENPKFKIPGLTFIEGSIGLKEHDIVHILLGRGMLELDESFVIGFTMGSSNKVSDIGEHFFSLISEYLYPNSWKMDNEEIEVFKDSIKLGFISDCTEINKIDFSSLLEMTIKDAREKVGIEKSLIKAYYEIEKKRYPNFIESQRLI